MKLNCSANVNKQTKQAHNADDCDQLQELRRYEELKTVIRELIAYANARKKWWLLPIIGLLAAVHKFPLFARCWHDWDLVPDADLDDVRTCRKCKASAIRQVDGWHDLGEIAHQRK